MTMTEQKRRISFYTLGCKVNQYETQALKEKFTQLGYEVVGEEEFADAYVINTCTVTGLSDRKSRQYIRRVKRINPNSVTAVVGCYVQVSPEEAAAIEGVNIVAGTNEKHQLPELIEEFWAARDAAAVDDSERAEHAISEPAQIRRVRAYEELGDFEEMGMITSMESRTRAFIKIQEGCNRFCTYCVIPYARGPVRSRGKDEIIAEAKNLIDKGFREIVLTGINAALYGTEDGFHQTSSKCTEDRELAVTGNENHEVYGIEVIVKALDELPGNFRIRLSSLEPNVISAEYAQRLLKYKRLCPHMHLSIQSGSDRILKAMNRSYGRAEYERIADVLKASDPAYGLTTDIIVGFPGETEEDFLGSIEMTKRVGFGKVHVFSYSKRQWTKAADLPDQISPQEKKRRSAALIEAAQAVSEDFYRRNIGLMRVVLFERYDEKNGAYEGLTDNYIKVYCRLPREEKFDRELLNELREVELIGLFQDGMIGRAIC